MDIQYLTLLKWILFLLVEFCRNAPGSYCRDCVDAGCCLECCFCCLEFFLYPAYSRGVLSLILPCRMLGCMGNSCWKMPCNDLHGMSLVVVVFLVEELILYVEISWSCWIACGNTVVLVGMDCIWKHHCTRRRLKYFSLDLLSPLLWK